MRRDGRIMVFYSAHNGGRMFYRVSARPYSIASLSKARTLGTNTAGRWGYTYPNPLRADGRLWLLFRGVNWQPNYTIRAGFHTSSGRRIAGLGSAPSVRRFERVRAYAGYKQWALDIAVSRFGPVIVYLRRTPRPEFWWARFDGEKWLNYRITRYARSPRSPGAVGGATGVADPGRWQLVAAEDHHALDDRRPATGQPSRPHRRRPGALVVGPADVVDHVLDPGPGRYARIASPSSDRAMTSRWISLVPS